MGALSAISSIASLAGSAGGKGGGGSSGGQQVNTGPSPQAAATMASNQFAQGGSVGSMWNSPNRVAAQIEAANAASVNQANQQLGVNAQQNALNNQQQNINQQGVNSLNEEIGAQQGSQNGASTATSSDAVTGD